MLKKLLPLLLCICLLWGCSNTVETVELQNRTLTIHREEKTITDGLYTYQYEASERDVRIIYPDGSWYQESINSLGRTMSWSDDYESDPDYADGGALVQAVESIQQKKSRSPGIWLGAGLLAAMGLFFLLAPELAWHIRCSLWIRNAEPTEFALNWCRFSGVVSIALAIILLMVHYGTR